MATISLALMKKRGIVRELAITNYDHKRYETNLPPHAHLICNDSCEIADIHFPLNAVIPDEHKQGFVIKDSQINFYGLCPLCKINDNPPSSQCGIKKTPLSFNENIGSSVKAKS
jgi:Fe2+ or Zn2+ uptake regulation protein